MYGTYGLEIDEIPITSDLKLHLGQKVKFIYPENTIDIHLTEHFLTLNNIYTIKDIKYTHPNYNQMIFQFEEIKEEDIGFNSRQFILDLNYNVSRFSKKYISYYYRKLKIKMNKLFRRDYNEI